jgi:hypothetical protein
MQKLAVHMDNRRLVIVDNCQTRFKNPMRVGLSKVGETNVTPPLWEFLIPFHLENVPFLLKKSISKFMNKTD